MLVLMSLGTALLIARHSLTGSRFILGMGIWVQGLVWVAAITLLW
jgi:hypothetical protein